MSRCRLVDFKEAGEVLKGKKKKSLGNVPLRGKIHTKDTYIDNATWWVTVQENQMGSNRRWGPIEDCSLFERILNTREDCLSHVVTRT